MQLDCTKCDGKCCKVPIDNFNVVLIPKEIDKFKNSCKLLKTEKGELFVLNKDSQGNCIFFDKTTAKCKNYKDRPFECKMFPIVIDYKRGFCLSKICPKINEINKETLKFGKKEWRKQNLPLNWIKAYSKIPVE